MKVRVTARANRDLLTIAEYINRENPSAAIKVRQRIERVFRLLETTPNIGRLSQAPGIREMVVRGLPFLVVYRVKGAEVQVLTIFHTSRDPRRKL